MEIDSIGVVGAGIMGHGIAQCAAQAGYRTLLCDVDEAALDRAVARIRKNLEKGIELGKVEREVAAAALRRLEMTTEPARVADAGLVIEAVPERLELKKEVLGRLGAMAPPATVLASNTSSLSIGEIARATGRPERTLGMHFFNPAHVMELLEIVVHEGTADDTLALARGVGQRMGKTSIVVRDVPGFATSRLGVLLGLEAMRMVEEGVASAEDIDTAMELGYRHPMGPLKLTDLVGLDVRLDIAEHLHAELGSDAFRPPEILRRMVAEGRLGKKSGRGFYVW